MRYIIDKNKFFPFISKKPKNSTPRHNYSFKIRCITKQTDNYNKTWQITITLIFAPQTHELS